MLWLYKKGHHQPPHMKDHHQPLIMDNFLFASHSTQSDDGNKEPFPAIPRCSTSLWMDHRFIHGLHQGLALSLAAGWRHFLLQMAQMGFKRYKIYTEVYTDTMTVYLLSYTFFRSTNMSIFPFRIFFSNQYPMFLFRSVCSSSTRDS